MDILDVYMPVDHLEEIMVSFLTCYFLSVCIFVNCCLHLSIFRISVSSYSERFNEIVRISETQHSQSYHIIVSRPQFSRGQV